MIRSAVLLMFAASCAAPLVQVSTSEPKEKCGQSVVVIGAVAAPGRFDVSETPTLLLAIDRAGGFTSEAHKNSVVVERCAGEVFHIAGGRVARGGEGDLALRSGDVVHVPAWD
jgi:protein involved in polysaccharide export with SLBB domain